MPELNRSQIDAMGDRMRDGRMLQGDSHLLSRFFQSYVPFGTATFSRVVAACNESLRSEADVFDITARNTKTVFSILSKLQRQSIKLSQIQDIVGCRIVILNAAKVDKAIDLLGTSFADVSLVDRRGKPQHGYRAAHLIVRDNSDESWRRFEIQIRSFLQHQWASLVEAVSLRYGLEVKYGGGPANVQEALAQTSTRVASFEDAFSGREGSQDVDVISARLDVRRSFDRILELWLREVQ